MSISRIAMSMAALAMMSGVPHDLFDEPVVRNQPDPELPAYRPPAPKEGRYMPHQGKREMARRLKRLSDAS